MQMCIMYVIFLLVGGGGIVYGYFPRNTVAVIGSPLVLHCKATSNDTSIIWKFRKLGGVGEETISNRTWIHKTGFSVNSSGDGQFSLVKTNTQPNDTGTYQCLGLRMGKLPQIAVAQIAVLVSPPECGTNASNTDSVVTENDFLNLWCQINYSGIMVPIIEWSRSDKRNLAVYRSDSNGEFYKSALSTITELMTSDEDGVRFECKIHFDQPPLAESQIGVKQATNVPDYSHSWYYDSKVLFGPRNVSIGPRKSQYSPGDVLVCSAKSNPRPTYEWIELSDTSFIIKGDALKLSKTLTGTQQFTYKCTATSTVSGRMTSVSDTIIVNVIAENQSDSSRTLTTIILTGGMTAGAFAAILFVCWFVYRLQKKKKQSKKAADASGSVNSAQDYDAIDEHVLSNLTDESTNLDHPDALTTLTMMSEDKDVNPVQHGRGFYTKLSTNRPLPVPSYYTPLGQREPPANNPLRAMDASATEVYNEIIEN